MSLLLEQCEIGTNSIDSVPHSSTFNNEARNLILENFCHDNVIIPDDQEINELVLELHMFKHELDVLFKKIKLS